MTAMHADVRRSGENRVAMARNTVEEYPLDPPFHPDQFYPEYPFGPNCLGAKNEAYRLVRECFHLLGLDRDNFGTPSWNPLKGIVSPGDKVLIKPNLVTHRHPAGGNLHCLITHGSVVRAVLDYVVKALDGRGKVIIGDAPVLSTDFGAAVHASGLAGIVKFYRQSLPLEIELVDFRTVSGELDRRFHVVQWRETPGDPNGNVLFDLGAESMLAPISHLSHRLRLPHYRAGDIAPYHGDRCHRYVVSRSVVEADVIINVPKMKTHCKAGATLGLKNLVGIVGRRHCFANYRRGSVIHGGDEYPTPSLWKSFGDGLERLIDGNPCPPARAVLCALFRANEFLIRLLRINPIRQGEWYGNDTVWRTILDLGRIACYGAADGELRPQPQRAIFTVIDGIIAGEDYGPLRARPKKMGCILAAFNPVAADIAAATIMGLDYRKIPTIRNAVTLKKWPLFRSNTESVQIIYEGQPLSLSETTTRHLVSSFVPPWGWRGHIELEGTLSY